ncbi:wd40 repeat-containing protein [Leptolyngbya sp. Heron Island J]|nr:wd40 repeat-containing protein [Leptolyngbya sp. Heron Island J]
MVVSVVYNPDGKTLASGSFDNSIKLWSVELGECLKTLEGHQLTILSLTYSPDGKTLASSSEDRTIRLWDVATGECLLIIKDDLCVDLDITGTIGLTEAQRTALKLMGAIDRDAPDDIE